MVGVLTETASGQKLCRKCGVKKPIENFYRNRRCRDGREYHCKTCEKARVRALYSDPNAQTARRMKRKDYELKNLDRKRETAAAWRNGNREKLREYSKTAERKRRDRKLKNYYDNREYFLGLARAWAARNKHKVAKYASERRARLAQRMPKWLTPAELLEISMIYENAAAMTELTGEPWHVDHILPLKGKYVSGLHVPSNLQLMPGIDNIRKNNVWIPE